MQIPQRRRRHNRQAGRQARRQVGLSKGHATWDLVLTVAVPEARAAWSKRHEWDDESLTLLLLLLLSCAACCCQICAVHNVPCCCCAYKGDIHIIPNVKWLKTGTLSFCVSVSKARGSALLPRYILLFCIAPPQATKRNRRPAGSDAGLCLGCMAVQHPNDAIWLLGTWHSTYIRVLLSSSVLVHVPVSRHNVNINISYRTSRAIERVFPYVSSRTVHQRVGAVCSVRWQQRGHINACMLALPLRLWS